MSFFFSGLVIGAFAVVAALVYAVKRYPATTDDVIATIRK
jgi:hypothetical protein